eukprot:scaffold103272_cov75-Phaeocystis_antarctica.AAC.1
MRSVERGRWSVGRGGGAAAAAARGRGSSAWSVERGAWSEERGAWAAVAARRRGSAKARSWRCSRSATARWRRRRGSVKRGRGCS